MTCPNSRHLVQVAHVASRKTLGDRDCPDTDPHGRTNS